MRERGRIERREEATQMRAISRYESSITVNRLVFLGRSAESVVYCVKLYDKILRQRAKYIAAGFVFVKFKVNIVLKQIATKNVVQNDEK